MGKVIITDDTTKYPITMIGKYAGECWGADTSDPIKNYKRGLECIKSEHGRTWEFPDVYMILDGYSARVIREWYTHIGGSPTRLQASTRYIDYEHGFDYIIPPRIQRNPEALLLYVDDMERRMETLRKLDDLGIPREDSANLLPLGMSTKIACKHNSRNLSDMSRQRYCFRAYWEYRNIMKDLEKALKEYSDEWKTFVELCFMPKCEAYGFCTEKFSCGKMPKKEEVFELIKSLKDKKHE